MAPLLVGDLEKLRWLRVAALHVVFSTLSQSAWSLIFGSKPSLQAFLSAFAWLGFFLILAAQMLFLAAIYLVAEPEYSPGVKIKELLDLVLSFLYQIIAGPPKDPSKQDAEWKKLSVSAKRAAFLALVAVSGVVSTYGFSLRGQKSDAYWSVRIGSLLGCLYAADTLLARRYVLVFPLIQRPWYLRLKLCLKPAVVLATLITTVTIILSEALSLSHLLPPPKTEAFLWRTFTTFCAGTLTVFCWELGRSLAQIILTEHHPFTPPYGSAAFEVSPNDELLSALQSPKPLTRHLAFLDLCHVEERNVDRWRQVALFRDESGTSYKKVIATCLDPLEAMIDRIKAIMGSGGGGFKAGGFQLQRGVSNGRQKGRGDVVEAIFRNFQICAWGARSAAALTAASHREDEFGIAQLSGSNARVLSTLLSALLAIESAQKAGLFYSKPRQNSPVFAKLLDRSGASSNRKPNKAAALADVIRVSLHIIAEEFAGEMLVFRPGSGPVLEDRDWLPAGSPLFATRAAHVEKLRAILDFRE